MAVSAGDRIERRIEQRVERRLGPGRVLLGFYLLFVVAAGGRSAVQLATDAGRAPVAYLLSAGAALVYLAGFVLVRRVERGFGPAMLRLCSTIELAGVLIVGAISVVRPSVLGADTTVWSDFGAGYLFVPLILPVAVFGWLHQRAAARTPRNTHQSR